MIRHWGVSITWFGHATVLYTGDTGVFGDIYARSFPTVPISRLSR